MPIPLSLRFLHLLFRTLWDSMTDKIFHLGILAFTLFYWLLSGRFSEHFWENILPWVVMLALMVVRDAYVSARALWKQVSEDRTRSGIRESGIFLPSGQRATVVALPEGGSYDGAKIIGMTLILSALVLLAVYLTWQRARIAEAAPAPVETGTKPQLQATEIYIDCHPIALPLHIPGMGMAHVKVFNKHQYENTKWAMDDIRNESSKELLWPRDALIKSVKFNPGVFGYKCDVANHATTNLIDLAIPLPANFGNEKPPLAYLAVISPLDAGTTFSFYMVNECPIVVSMGVPDTATVQVFGEDIRRTVPLHWPHRNPIERIMMFLPSKVRWTGNVCE